MMRRLLPLSHLYLFCPCLQPRSLRRALSRSPSRTAWLSAASSVPRGPCPVSLVAWSRSRTASPLATASPWFSLPTSTSWRNVSTMACAPVSPLPACVAGTQALTAHSFFSCPGDCSKPCVDELGAAVWDNKENWHHLRNRGQHQPCAARYPPRCAKPSVGHRCDGLRRSGRG